MSDSSVTYTAIGLNVANLGASTDSSLLKLNVNGSTKFRIDMDGNMSAGGGSKQTIWIPARAMIPRLSNGATYSYAETTTNKVVYQSLSFSNSSNQFAQFEISFPKSWDTTKNLSYKVVWSHANTEAAPTSWGVRWRMRAMGLATDANPDSSSWGAETIIDDNTSTTSTANTIQLSNASSDLVVSGAASNTITYFQIYREAGAGTSYIQSPVKLHGVHIYYNTNGSD
jgi:hypothetical protein